MKYQNYLLLIFGISLSGCFAPSNLTYESARTLDKGCMDVQANYSKYYYSKDDTLDYKNSNNNFGFKLG